MLVAVKKDEGSVDSTTAETKKRSQDKKKNIEERIAKTR